MKWNVLPAIIKKLLLRKLSLPILGLGLATSLLMIDNNTIDLFYRFFLLTKTYDEQVLATATEKLSGESTNARVLSRALYILST